MKCLGCYKETVESYCNSCRRKLFDGIKINSVLPFDAPKADNIKEYHEHTKGLSISGVQLKYSLKIQNKQFVFTEKGGQYILKPIPPAKHLAEPASIPENEHATMQLASRIFNIVTAENALINFADKESAYITRRFDVINNSAKSLQEDFAQLTNRSEKNAGKNYKYEGSYEEIGVLIRKHVAGAIPALETFFELLIFNYVVSNGDAHLKNFSLIMQNTGDYTLTPAYDLMCTRLHTPSESDVALDLYKNDMNTAFYNAYGFYGREDFMELALKLGLVPRRAERIINKYQDLEKDAVAFIEQTFLEDRVKETYIELMKDKIHRFKLKV